MKRFIPVLVAVSKPASVKDVARAAQVSVGTVSNFLNKTKVVSPAVQQQIESAITDLGYRRNEVASSLRRARTHALGMILPNVSNPFYTSLFESAEAEAKRRGYAMTLGVTHYDARPCGNTYAASRAAEWMGSSSTDTTPTVARTCWPTSRRQ